MKIRTGRLRKLAKHLRSKNRFHKKFEIGLFTYGKVDKDGNPCESEGDAVGEFPAIWPKEWRWVQKPNTLKSEKEYNFDIIHKQQCMELDDDNRMEIYENTIAKFFSITRDQATRLFPRKCFANLRNRPTLISLMMRPSL